MNINERYTWQSCIDGYTDTGLRKGITEGDAICQLADYEDTGLSPSEIKERIKGVHARWEYDGTGREGNVFVCTNCFKTFNTKDNVLEFEYCMYCGAKMDETS